MKLKTLVGAVALGLMGAANANIICDACSFQSGSAASYLGDHSPLTSDNSTFSNAATGFNGSFTNWWAFDVNPSGRTSIDAIQLNWGPSPICW